MFSLWIAAVLGLICAQRGSAAATTSVTCSTDLWTFNEAGFSPCLVGSALQAACNGGTWNISPLGPNQEYGGPFRGQSNKCVCSTVVYSLVSACGACQSASIIKWAQWTANCTASDITISQFPVTFPPNISVPSWAYLNVTIEGVWDSTAALNAHNSSGAVDSTVAAVASSTGAGAGAAAPTGTTSPGKKSNHAGAIAGGVVGGVIGLVLIAIGVFVFMRRRSATKTSSTVSSGAEKFDLAASPGMFRENDTTLSMHTEPPKLYDPSDPSTFPGSPAPTFPTYAASTAPSESAVQYGHPQSPQPLLSHNQPYGGYTGVAEI